MFIILYLCGASVSGRSLERGRRRKTIYSSLIITSGRFGLRDPIRPPQLVKTAPIGTIGRHFGNISS